MRGGFTEGSPVRVICNPASGGGAYEPAFLRAVLRDLKPDWVVTKALGDAREAAREWRGGLLVVAGGDGTVNEVVNGLGTAGFPGDVTLALLPTGTGNDLAATLNVPADPKRAAEVIRAGRMRTLDAARIRSRGVGEVLFANVAVGGAGARASEAADDETFKGRWRKLSYLRASLEVARSLETYEARLTVDGIQHRVRAANLVVGNCRYAGGGWPAAPRANPEDGLLDLVVIEDMGLSEMLTLTPRALTRANYQESEGVFFARGKDLRIETCAPGGLEFNADGESVGRGPVEFAAIPRALRVVVGPGYTPEPERWPEESRHAKSRFKTWGRSLLPILGRGSGKS